MKSILEDTVMTIPKQAGIYSVISNPDAEIKLMTEEQTVEFDKKMQEKAEIRNLKQGLPND